MANPVEQFEIKPVIPMSVGDYDISLTNSSVFMIAAVFCTVFLMIAGTANRSVIPGRIQSVCEMLYEFVAGMIRDNTGSDGKRYFPFVFSLFMFILFGNMLGLIPYSFTFTSHIIVTFGLAFMVITAVTVYGFILNGKKFFGLFAPSGVPLPLMFLIVPLEIISFLVRPITLSMRLFANMMAGHMILKVFAGFAVMMAGAGFVGYIGATVPVLVNVAIYMLELLVAVLHAYIFSILTCAYLKDTVDLHH